MPSESVLRVTKLYPTERSSHRAGPLIRPAACLLSPPPSDTNLILAALAFVPPGSRWKLGPLHRAVPLRRKGKPLSSNFNVSLSAMVRRCPCAEHMTQNNKLFLEGADCHALPCTSSLASVSSVPKGENVPI